MIEKGELKAALLFSLLKNKWDCEIHSPVYFIHPAQRDTSIPN